MTCLSLYSLAPKNGRTAKTLTCLAHGLKHSNFSRKTAHVLAKPAKCGKCLIYRCYLCTVFTPSSDFLNSTLGKKNEDSLAKPNLKSKKPHERILQTCGISAVNPPKGPELSRESRSQLCILASRECRDQRRRTIPWGQLEMIIVAPAKVAGQVTRSKPFLSRNLFTACPCWRELASNTANIW